MMDPVLFQAKSSIAAEIRLNRSERANALNEEVVYQFTRAVAECFVQKTKLLVIRGEGRHFCSGFDRVAGDRATTAARAVLGVQIEALLQMLWNAPFATVACIQGSAVGAGADIAAACDYRLAQPDAVFFFPGFRLLGVSLGNRRLARLIGAGRAMDAILRTRKFNQQQAAACGLAQAMADHSAASSYISNVQTALRTIDRQSIPQLRCRIRGELQARQVATLCSAQPAMMH